jgi:mycothiol system anti-sigma-R factor
MSDNCDEALANLYRYLDNEMNDEVEAARIRAHLADCPPCGGAFEFEQRLRVVVRSHLHETVQPAMIERIRVLIRHERGL